MSTITKLEEINAWKESRELVKMIYQLTQNPHFSKDFALKEQIRRSAISVMSNIAEGYSRKTSKEFSQFLYISRGSLTELQSQLYISHDINYISGTEFKFMQEKTIKVAKLINGFLKYLASVKKPQTANRQLPTMILLLLSLLSPSYAVEIRNVQVTDQAGNARNNYTNSERINFNVKVNSAISGERVSFRFEVYDPAGVKKFTHTGNSIPGSAGEGGSSVRNVPIGNFYTTPGNYKLVVYGNTALKETVFSVYSPNITLTYPANGMRDLTDKPLVFRWVASGASKYRLYVDDDAAFFNCLFKEETILTQYTYPVESSDVRQKLSAGTVYYWKVEALDPAGNPQASTLTPFSFTIKSGVLPPTAKDIGVTDISVMNQQVAVTIKNQGGKPERGIPVSLYLGGKPQGSVNVDMITAGESKAVRFTPNVYGAVMAMAMITFDDDYIKNNIMTRQLNIVMPVVISTPIFEVRGSIHGSVMDSGGRKLSGALVNYESAHAKGGVAANSGGEYKIDDLAYGVYKLTVAADGYEKSEQTVRVDKNSVTNIDFRLTKLIAEELISSATTQAEPPRQYNAAQTWDMLKKYVKDREVLKELEGYEPVGFEPSSDMNKLIAELENGTAAIIGVELKTE